MSKILPFTKMQGAGNDYVYVNGFEVEISDPSELARRISDRHFGVGGDGLVLILPSAAGDIRMRMFNADGTEAEMCGNATRCVGKYAYEHGLVKKDVIKLETGAGIRVIHLHLDAGAVAGATVDMGKPVIEPDAVPVAVPGASSRVISEPIEVGGVQYRITAVSMGNPHAVIFMTGIDDLDLAAIGPLVESHPWFPQRTNTEFVEVLSSDRIRMRVWERGAGETLACGTGACAAVVACVLNGLTGAKVDVELRGGSLQIDWDRKTDHVYMTGPAVTVFEGRYFY